MATSEVMAGIRRRIGWERESVDQLVEAGQVRRFCQAIGDDSPRWQDEAPPTFVVSLGLETPQLPELLAYGTGWLNGGDRFEYLEPVRVGDRITSRIRLVDAQEKQGSGGGLLILTFETTYTNQHGRVAVRQRGTRIRR
jgi:hypothetical protein